MAAKANKKTTTATKKNDISTSAFFQYKGLEFSEADCIKKVTSGFKKEHKDIELESLNIYIKPEENKIYYVANKDVVGSVDL